MWDIAELGLKVKSDDFDVATGRMRKFKDEAGATEMAMNKLARVAGTLAGALVGAFAVSKLTAYADAWSDMQSKVGAAVKDMDAAPKLMKRLVEVANASYSPLQQTVEIYARNVAVLREMGLGAEQAADFTESLNHMLVITATKGEQAASVQQALTKAMAVGRLQADGLESVLASGGRVAEALAKELGTTTNGLRDMASQGKITSAVIANALLKSLEDVRKQAGEMPATIADGFTRINTNVQAFVGQLDKALGVSAAIASGLVSFADSILMVTNSGFIEWIADSDGALKLVGQALMVLAATQVPALIRAGTLAVTTFRALGATFLAQYYLTSNLTGAVGVLRGALAALGGPWGIALAAATAIGLAMWNNRDAAIPLSDSLKKVATAQRDFNVAMTEYDNTKTNASLVAAKEAADAAIATLEAAVASARDEVMQSMAKVKVTDPGSFFRSPTYAPDDEAISAAQARLAEIQAALDKAKSDQASLTEQQAKLAESMGVAVENMSQDQINAFKSANDMLVVNERRLALLQLEKQYGAESVAYLTAQFEQERQIYFAKVDALNVADQLKTSLKESWLAAETAAGKTKEWDASMRILEGAAGDVWAMLKNIRDTEPGKTWLDTAISKASTLWSKLADAADAFAAMSDVQLDDAGNPIPNGISRNKRPRRPPALLGETGTDPGSGGSGGASNADQYKEEVKQLKESTEALKNKTAAMQEAAASGGDYKRALAILEEKQKLLNAAQQAGVAITPALKAEVDALATAYVDATEQLTKMQEQTQKGEDAFKNLFGAILQGADAAKQAVINLILEIAKVQFTKGMMGLLGQGGGSGLIGLIGNALSMDGGGYTGNAPRSGGVDGKGGFWGIMHPKETVIDHTKGSRSGASAAGGSTAVDVDVRAYVDDDGNWQAKVEKISDRSASKVGARIAKDLPAAVNKINNTSPRRR